MLDNMLVTEAPYAEEASYETKTKAEEGRKLDQSEFIPLTAQMVMVHMVLTLNGFF